MWKIFLSPCFNTQPPEGGCQHCRLHSIRGVSFNTQPPEGGCPPKMHTWRRLPVFQHTAARRRLLSPFVMPSTKNLCFNTQLPEGGCLPRWLQLRPIVVSTHSCPKAAADGISQQDALLLAFQHTAARRRLHLGGDEFEYGTEFQHTAARRRLLLMYMN